MERKGFKMEQKEFIKELCESIISFEEDKDDCIYNGGKRNNVE